jgi:hypothetical protein
MPRDPGEFATLTRQAGEVRLDGMKAAWHEFSVDVGPEVICPELTLSV